uniref:Uncharacterized protein n=1 Tax=Rhizophora mucronata TaxID=61149 RepID=A0A2P2PVJ3_RHIMU
MIDSLNTIMLQLRTNRILAKKRNIATHEIVHQS